MNLHEPYNQDRLINDHPDSYTVLPEAMQELRLTSVKRTVTRCGQSYYTIDLRLQIPEYIHGNLQSIIYKTTVYDLVEIAPTPVYA